MTGENNTVEIKLLFLCCSQGIANDVDLQFKTVNPVAAKPFFKISFEFKLVNTKELPTPAFLSNFDVIMVDTCSSALQCPKELGDLLADFSDTGKGLVVCAKTNCNSGMKNQNLDGRFITGKYHPLKIGQFCVNEAQLMTILEPRHPLFANVTKIMFTYDRMNSAVMDEKESKVLAKFGNTSNAVVTKLAPNKNSMVVALNMFSSKSFHQDQESLRHLLFNAVVYAYEMSGKGVLRDYRPKLWQICSSSSYVDLVVVTGKG